MPTQPLHINDFRGRIEAAIITVREDEFEAVQEGLKDAIGERTRTIEGGKNDYEYTQLPTLRGGDPINVALTRCVHQGNRFAQVVTSNILEDLDPDWLLLVGIAGGKPDHEYSLGDVILANRLHDFSFGGVNPRGEISYETGGGDMHQAVERLFGVKLVGSNKNELRELARFDEDLFFCNHPPLIPDGKALEDCVYGPDDYREKLLEMLRDRFPDGRRSDGPRVHQGPCANADIVVKDPALLEQWKQSARQVVQVETELSGVYHAARYSGRENYPVLSIRGLSDIIGLRRTPEWTKYACRTAGAFAVALLRSGFINFADGGRARPRRDIESDQTRP